ncbi:hypothetical protein EV401DRAFT_2053412 [Pisolithus croceorrhizus]|nr:hypothetical protein EV401DRAFT_2053412 [Pisolithus croceorrhizus]
MRQLVRYDLEDSSGSSKPLGTGETSSQPPSKKRKYNQQKGRGTHVQHWDDPGTLQDAVVYDEQEDDTFHENLQAEVKGEIEESRELTYDEIWDDSALVDAWNSAQAEYEAFHGKSKDWKKEPIKKSSLWYNVPQASVGKRSEVPKDAVVEGDADNTAPIDFDTFVPTYDPSLSEPQVRSLDALNAMGSNASQSFLPPASTSMVSRDEAFNNALSAMYWSGYWTAVYHCQRNTPKDEVPADEEGQDYDGEGEELEGGDADEAEEDLVPAQR